MVFLLILYVHKCTYWYKVDHVTGLRTCQYYEEIQEQSSATQYQGKHVKWLAPISQPRDFWCNEENYEGPSVLENLKVHS
jgi:hypothetical protein